jgi:OHCU decarboxylase
VNAGAAAGLDWLNGLTPGACAEALRRCCGSDAWVEAMIAARPFASREALLDRSDRAWRSLASQDWLQAFAAHPRIGERSATGWAAGEQAGARGAPPEVLARLAEANRAYEARFGHIFIVCATGRSAEEMLALLDARLENAPDAELRIAAEEQRKITRLRLEKLLADD